MIIDLHLSERVHSGIRLGDDSFKNVLISAVDMKRYDV